MPVRKAPGGKYLPWYYDIEAKGRARKRAARPKRDALMVHTALKKLGVRYCTEVSFWNPSHVGKQGDLTGGLQWVDFVVRKKRPIILILDDPRKRWKQYEKDYHANKLAGLKARGIPYVVLPAGKTSQEYQIMIWINLKRKGVL